MIDVLETLAKMGIVSLPEHDSVICPVEHRDSATQVMKQVYQRHMGCEIQVKAPSTTRQRRQPPRQPRR